MPQKHHSNVWNFARYSAIVPYLVQLFHGLFGIKYLTCNTYTCFQTFPDCRAITHYQNSGGCFIWDSCTEFSESSCTDCISGDSSCDAYVNIRHWHCFKCYNNYTLSHRYVLLLGFAMTSLLGTKQHQMRLNAAGSAKELMAVVGTHLMPTV